MTKKERIKAVINGIEPDVTPYHFDLTLMINDKIAEYYNIEKDSVESFIGNHLLYLDFSAPEGFTPGRPGANLTKDEFGVTWDIGQSHDIGDWGMVDHPIKDMSLEGYKFPNTEGKGRFKGVEELVEKNPDRFNVMRMTGLFDSAWHITGMEDLLISMVVEPGFADEILEKTADYIVGIIEQLPPCVEAVRLIEDWGKQNGLIMGLERWNRFLKPGLKRIHDACRKKGVRIMHHTCGDITELFPEIIELGVDVIDAMQPEAMDLKFIKKEYGKDIVLFGGLGCQSTIPLGTPEDVVKEAQETLNILGEGGKYILGPAGSIPTEAPVENVIALVGFCKEIANE